MILLPDWKLICKRAWSLRLMLLAVVLTALEVALPYLGADVPPALFAGLSGIVIVGAMVARVVAQKNLGE